MDTRNMDRRTALALLAAGTAGASAALPVPAGAATNGAAARRAPAFDPTDQRQLALAFRKLAWSADDQVSFWWMRGTRYGVQGSVATPFWDMYVAAWFTTRDTGDGTYEVKLTGANFYTPVGRDTLLEKFDNPYTGKTVDVPYGRPRASVTQYDLKGGSPFGGKIPGMKSTLGSDIGPAWVEGDEIGINGDLMLHAEPEQPGPGRRTLTVNDWSTYVGSLREVMDPAVRNPAAMQTFVDVLDFPAWLQMGDTPGTFVSRCYARKVKSYAAMPATWRRHFEAKFPDLAQDPGALVRF
jgi:hypothetical protein